MSAARGKRWWGLLGLTAAISASGPNQPLLKEGLSFSSVPFRPGEHLVYEVNWKPLFFAPAFKAGELSMDIEKSRYLQKDAFKISAWAISNGALPRVAGLEVRNYFESIIDKSNFRSYRMLKRTRQGNRKRDVEVMFDYSTGQVRVRETDVGAEPPEELRNEVLSGIPGPLTDILSVFYVARLRDMTVGDQYLIYLSDNGKHRAVQVYVERKEKVRTGLGQFNTVKITTQGGLFSGGGDFRVWYSQDGLRLPVKFEADVRFGKVYGQIIQLQTEGLSRGLIRTS